MNITLHYKNTCDLAGSRQNITLRYKNTCGLAGGSPDDAVIWLVIWQEVTRTLLSATRIPVIRQLVTRTSSFTATRGCCGLAGGSPDDAVIRQVVALIIL
jgi:hypothetical protein